MARVGVGLFAWLPEPDDYGLAGDYWLTMFVGIGLVTLVMSTVPRRLPRRALVRWPLLAVTALAAAALGATLQDAWVRAESGLPIAPEWLIVHRHTLIVVSSTLGILSELKRSHQAAQSALHRARLARLGMKSELAYSRLLLLHAQIEPHFLFNSLANVRRLLRTDETAGRAMLVDLLHYLEGALPRLRGEAATLKTELELARAYLAVWQVRMGERLRIEFDVEDRVLARAVPPMMLLTLVENALKHGLAPLVAGGRLYIGASEDHLGRLHLSVADTGVGISEGPGGGTGLANIRARLAAIHGDRAHLSLRMNLPRGVVATIRLPS